MRADFTMPVSDFLDSVRAGLLDTNLAPDLEKDEQISHYNWIIAALEHLSEDGDLPGPRDYNQLKSGIWEIKRFNLRITFFDTDGHGHFDPKIDFEGGGLWSPPDLPDFDYYLRLATAFIKPPSVVKTPLRELQLALAVRKEDVAHDLSKVSRYRSEGSTSSSGRSQ